jgi:protein-tyrosine-phosphatase
MLLRKLQTLRLRMRANRALRDARTSSLKVLGERRGTHILVVCHGNIYRSALVGEYLRLALGRAFQVRSAGFHPVSDRPAPERHVAMSELAGVDLRAHRSCVVSKEQLAWADLIVLMDRRNWVSLQRAGADAAKFCWLGALSAGPVEIPDPYGADDAAAQAIIDRLLVSSGVLAERLRSASAISGSTPQEPAL